MEKKIILLIEDDLDIAKMIKKRLEHAGYTVITATGGYEGLYRYLKDRPDLIILDLQLPQLNGYEVCREIRRQLRDLKTPIMMVTANTEDYDRIKGRVIGATQYITKPFKWPELLKEIETALLPSS